MPDLSMKQRAFVDHYIELGNATEAYKLAGYSCKSDRVAGVEGHKLLKNPKIRDAIAQRVAEKDEARIAKQDEVLQYLTKVMRGDETEEVVVVEGQGDGCSEARALDKSVGAKDRIKAAELLGKRYGIFNDKLDINVPVTVVIEDDYGDD